MSLAFIVVQKYYRNTKIFRIISRSQEEIFQKFWKPICGKLGIKYLKDLRYVDGCHRVGLSFMDNYDKMNGKVVISKKYADIFGLEEGKMIKQKKFLEIGKIYFQKNKQIYEKIKKEEMDEYINSKYIDKWTQPNHILTTIIAKMKQETKTTIESCLKYLKRTKVLIFSFYSNKCLRFKNGLWDEYLDGSKTIVIESLSLDRDDYFHLSRVKFLAFGVKSFSLHLDPFIHLLQSTKVLVATSHSISDGVEFTKLKMLKELHIIPPYYLSSLNVPIRRHEWQLKMNSVEVIFHDCIFTW